MIILGLNFGHDGSGCIVKDGKVLAATSSERITRNKKQRGVTLEVIGYLLNKAGLEFTDINLVAVTNWFSDRDPNTGRDLFDKNAHGFSIKPKQLIRQEWKYGTELSLQEYDQARRNNLFCHNLTLSMGNYLYDCIIVDHHFAHCCYGFFMSPYKNAIALSVDFNDNFGANHGIYYFDETNSFIRIRSGGDFDVGSTYGCICEYLGFYPSLVDAGKVMGLAAYGMPHLNYQKLSWPNSNICNDTYLAILLNHGIKHIPQHRILYPQLKGEGGVPDTAWLNKEDWNNDLNKNIAATMQNILEESIHNLVKEVAENTYNLSRNLCLVGGTMLNCVSNGNILKSKLFDNVYAAPACGDEGLATGSALGLNHFLLERPKIQHTIKETFEGGVSYTAAQIEQSILPFSDLVSFSKMDEIGLLNKATDAIAEGKIIAWFEGGSEVGPRALGHRSIIVDPRRKDMKDILNARVKHREPFRPFAPAVLIEHARDWFDLEGESPFMLFSVQCLKPDQLPATTHVDGSARVQTVDADNNGRYYQLIKTFYNKFEVPVLLNTSFNDNGEPIVETPTDALRCFLKTEIDVLILEDFYVEKKV